METHPEILSRAAAVRLAYLRWLARELVKRDDPLSREAAQAILQLIET